MWAVGGRVCRRAGRSDDVGAEGVASVHATVNTPKYVNMDAY